MVPARTPALSVEDGPAFTLHDKSEAVKAPFETTQELRENGFCHYLVHPDSLAHLILNTLADMTGTVRRRRGSYHPIEPTSSIHSLKAEIDPSLSRRKRWAILMLAILRRMVIVGPVFLLMLFGALHLVQVIIGQARLFWDQDNDDFLPNWGQPGHLGEFVAKYPTDATRDVMPVRVHSHNDYWRRIPLFEALHYGAIGVEADVWLYDDDLYVGHNKASLTRNRTLQSLYVNPLVQLLDQQNPTTDFANTTGHGVFDTDSEQTLVLLIDMKTDGNLTWPAVQAQLEPLREKGYLSYWNGSDTTYRAITVVGTGNTPFDLVTANTTYRDIFFDAPLDKLFETPQSYSGVQGSTVTETGDDTDTADSNSTDQNAAKVYETQVDAAARYKRDQGNEGLGSATADDFNNGTSYYASIDFHAAVGKVWRGHLSPKQMDIIRGQIRGAKRRGLKSRYWNTPSWPISVRNHVWHVLLKEGADILNADDLRSASRLDWRRWTHEWW